MQPHIVTNDFDMAYISSYHIRRWHHGNITRLECQKMLERAFLSSIKTRGRAINAWLVRFSRNNEQTISVVFAKGTEVRKFIPTVKHI